MFDPEKAERWKMFGGYGGEVLASCEGKQIEIPSETKMVLESEYDQLLKLYQHNKIALKSVTEVVQEQHNSLRRFTKAMIHSPS